MPKLYVVATPIGNLSDVSARVLDTFRAVALVAAEDTRVTGSLLHHFGIAKPMVSLHRHNEESRVPGIVARMLAEDVDVALATDAGTPAISDPGYLFVAAAWESGIEVIPIPGPTALASALSICGFDTREFAFYGFLPRERADLAKKLRAIARETKIAVLYESPHRVVSLMKVVLETLPAAKACVCCDLTKLYEKTVRGDAAEVYQLLLENPKVNKGEYCVVLDLHDMVLEMEHAPSAASVEAQLFQLLLEGHPSQAAVDEAVKGGARKNEAKRAMLRVRQFIRETAQLDFEG